MLATSNPINQKKGKNRRRNKKKQTKAKDGDTGVSFTERAVESTKTFEFQGLKEFQARVSLYALVSSLPGNVLKRISQHLFLQKDRLSFSLVNKAWHEAGNEALWYTPSFWSTSRFALFYRAITVNAKLASSVVELNLVLSDTSENQIFFSEDPQCRLLRKSPIADAHIIQKLVKACKSLKRLHMYGWNFDDTSMKKVLSVATEVTALRVVGSDALTQRPFLEAPMKLQSFVLDANLQLNDLFVRISSSRFQALKSLHLAASNISEKGFNILADNIQNLQELCIHQSPGFNDTIVEKLTRNCFNLEKISIQHCGITLSSLQLLVESNVNLKEIRLNLDVADDDESAVSWMMPICESLELLSLENAMIDDDLLQNIGMHCPKIRDLSLVQCDLVTDDCIRFFSESLEGLANVHLANCEHLTGGSLFSLLSLQRKSLRSITFKFNGDFDVSNETKNLLRNAPNLQELKLQGYESQIATKEWCNLLKRFRSTAGSTQTPFLNFISNLQESPSNSRPTSPPQKETRKRDTVHENEPDSAASVSKAEDENSTKKKKKESVVESTPVPASVGSANGAGKPESIQRVIPWREWGEGSEDSEEEVSGSPMPPATPKVEQKMLQGSGKFGTIRKGDALNFLQQLQAVPDILEPEFNETQDFQYTVEREKSDGAEPMDIPPEESEDFVYSAEKDGSPVDQPPAKPTELVKFTYNPYAPEFFYQPKAKSEAKPAEVNPPVALNGIDYEEFVYHADQDPIASATSDQFEYTMDERSDGFVTEEFNYGGADDHEAFTYVDQSSKAQAASYDQLDQDAFVYATETESIHADAQDLVFTYPSEAPIVEASAPFEDDSNEFVYTAAADQFSYSSAKDDDEFSYQQEVSMTAPVEEMDSGEFVYTPQENESEFIYNVGKDKNSSCDPIGDSDEEFVYSDVKEELSRTGLSDEAPFQIPDEMNGQSSSDEFVYTKLEVGPSELSAETEEFVYSQPADQSEPVEFVYSNEKKAPSPVPEFIYLSNEPAGSETAHPLDISDEPVAPVDVEPSYSYPEEHTPTNKEFAYPTNEEFIYSEVENQIPHQATQLPAQDAVEPMNEVEEYSDPELWVGWKTEDEWKRISNNKLSATNVFFKNALSADEAEETLKGLKGYERMIHSAPGSTPGSKTQRQGTLRKQLANFLAEASQIRNEKKEQIQYQTYLEGNELPANMYMSNDAMDWEQARSAPNYSEYYHHNAYPAPYEEYPYEQLEPPHGAPQMHVEQAMIPAHMPLPEAKPAFQIQEFGSIGSGFKFDYEQIMKEVESLPRSIRDNFAQKSKENVGLHQVEYSANHEEEFEYSAHKYDTGVDEDADDEDEFEFDYTKIKGELKPDDTNHESEVNFSSNAGEGDNQGEGEEEEFNYLQYSQEGQDEPERPEVEEFNYLAEVESKDHQNSFDYLVVKSVAVESSDEEFNYMVSKEQTDLLADSTHSADETFDYMEAKNEVSSDPIESTPLLVLPNDGQTATVSITPADSEEFDYSMIKRSEKKIHPVSLLQEHAADTVPSSPFESSPSWERQVFKEERKLFDTLSVEPMAEQEFSYLDSQGEVNSEQDAPPAAEEKHPEEFGYQSDSKFATSNPSNIETQSEETFDYVQEKTFEVAESTAERPSHKASIEEYPPPAENYSEQYSELHDDFTHILEPAMAGGEKEQIFATKDLLDSAPEEYVAAIQREKSSKSELEHKVFGQASNILKSLLDQAHQSDVEKEQDMSSPEMESKEDKKSRKKKKKEKELERKQKEQERKEKKERREKEQKEKEKEKAQKEKQKDKKKHDSVSESADQSTTAPPLYPTLQDSAIEQLLLQLEDKKEHSSKEKKKEIQLDIDKVKSFTESSQDSLATSTNNGKTDEILNSILEMLGLNEGETKGSQPLTNGNLVESDEVNLMSEPVPTSEKKSKKSKSQKQDSVAPEDGQEVQPSESENPAKSKEKNSQESPEKSKPTKSAKSTKSADKILEQNTPEVVSRNGTSEPRKSKSRSRSSKGRTLVRLDIETRRFGQQLLCVKEADLPDHVVERFCYKYDLVDLMPGLLRYVKKIVAKKQRESRADAQMAAEAEVEVEAE
ncbi:hypothetical protein K493DRAFT_106186 [Basidiobolus meristosporus CBS 931.73]|uniref:F-box domain-containing protein n=1 Tax=Basidiobolus meristosporus CBS 931.73 TaxID=1314790 RepID=A0A1Y1WW26_9FUNG|nr:hypothetical protein K493DRAFT_106186 [Basidiobolus meristosporus CBS 931.73]|eukprot:ORX77334.1 hypothetical protein K493DRAFT_106186 [Basidiobolus meristosporus CBS 931.73]